MVITAIKSEFNLKNKSETMSSTKQMRFNCECCGYATDKKSSMTTHEKTKKHASNLAKNQVQIGDAKEQHERDLMGLEDVNVFIPEPKVKEPKVEKQKKYTKKDYIRIINDWYEMNSKGMAVKGSLNVGEYVKIIENNKISVEEVEEWKKGTEIEREGLLDILYRYNKLAEAFRYNTELSKKYGMVTSKHWTIPLLKQAINRLGLTDEKFDNMDKEYAIENEKFLERQRKIQEHRDKQQMEIERLKGLIEECDEDTQIEIAKEFMEIKSVSLREYIMKTHQDNRLYHPIPDPTRPLIYLNERGGCCNYTSQFRYKITWDNEKNWWDEDANVTFEVDLKWYKIEGKNIDIYTEIIERHYDNYTRGFVMK